MLQWDRKPWWWEIGPGHGWLSPFTFMLQQSASWSRLALPVSLHGFSRQTSSPGLVNHAVCLLTHWHASRAQSIIGSYPEDPMHRHCSTRFQEDASTAGTDPPSLLQRHGTYAVPGAQLWGHGWTTSVWWRQYCRLCQATQAEFRVHLFVCGRIGELFWCKLCQFWRDQHWSTHRSKHFASTENWQWSQQGFEFGFGKQDWQDAGCCIDDGAGGCGSKVFLRQRHVRHSV